MEKLLFYLVIAVVGGILTYLKNQRQNTSNRERKAQQRPTAPVVNGKRLSYDEMLKKIRQEQAGQAYESVEQLPDDESALTDIWGSKTSKAQPQHMGRPSDVSGRSSGFGKEERNPVSPPVNNQTRARESHLKPTYKPIVLTEEEQQLSALAKQRLQAKAQVSTTKSPQASIEATGNQKGLFSGDRLKDAIIAQTVLERRHF